MSNGFDFLIYKAADEEVSVNAVIKDDTIWLTQKSMAELFEVTPQTITRHLANIYEEEELYRDSTCTKIVQVQIEGNRQVKRNVDIFNLDAIISVGYRVNSKRATHFRQWATGVLKEYMIKGFALDDDRLKQGNISESCSKEFALSVQANAEFGSKLQIYSPSAVLITTKPPTLQSAFTPPCKTNSIMRLPIRLPLKLFTTVPIKTRSIWD